MRRGVRIAVDVGTVRIGVAVCDPDGVVASPVETLTAGKGDVSQLARLVAEREAIEVVVGLPRSLSGREGPAADAARAYARGLARAIAPVPVRLTDERLSTVSATRNLRQAGVRSRKGRSVVDQVAAVIILQSALDAERISGSPPGQVVRTEP
jgi:putative holliday junction resolvase